MADPVTGIPQLQARLAAVGKVGPTIMQRLAIATVANAKRNTAPNRKTGNLERSIGVVSATPARVLIVAGARYAGYVELGTRGGTIITPRARLALAWAPGPAGGAFQRLSGSPRSGVGRANMIFAKRVRRGATRPFPFLRPGALQAIEQLGLAQQIRAAWRVGA